MPRLSARVSRLEQETHGNERRPVLLITPSTDVGSELAAWQLRYGPCEAEPVLIHLVGLAPS